MQRFVNCWYSHFCQHDTFVEEIDFLKMCSGCSVVCGFIGSLQLFCKVVCKLRANQQTGSFRKSDFVTLFCSSPPGIPVD